MKFVTISFTLFTTFVVNVDAAGNKQLPSLQGAIATSDFDAANTYGDVNLGYNADCVSGDCELDGKPCCQWPGAPEMICTHPADAAGVLNSKLKCLPSPPYGPPVVDDVVNEEVDEEGLVAEETADNEGCTNGLCDVGGTPCCQFTGAPEMKCLKKGRGTWAPHVCRPESSESDVSLRGSDSAEDGCTTGWCTGLQACCVPGFKCLDTPGSGAAAAGFKKCRLPGPDDGDETETAASPSAYDV